MTLHEWARLEGAIDLGRPEAPVRPDGVSLADLAFMPVRRDGTGTRALPTRRERRLNLWRIYVATSRPLSGTFSEVTPSDVVIGCRITHGRDTNG